MEHRPNWSIIHRDIILTPRSPDYSPVHCLGSPLVHYRPPGTPPDEILEGFGINRLETPNWVCSLSLSLKASIQRCLGAAWALFGRCLGAQVILIIVYSFFIFLDPMLYYLLYPFLLILSFFVILLVLTKYGSLPFYLVYII